MKGYKRFIVALALVLAIYIVAEMNRPKPLDWNVTLSGEDKNPYGGYVLYQQLKSLFPKSTVGSFRVPVYNQVNNFEDENTAYILISPTLSMSGEDVNELLDYVVSGNYVFMASETFSKALMDSLNFSTDRRLDWKKGDSATINFVNPHLNEKTDYRFKHLTIDGYISELDTLNAVVLGTNNQKDANFIKMPYGEGAFFIHALPLCFSNYFMLTNNNATYVAKALSYLPPTIDQVFWDEYYKLGPSGSQSPLRFFLNNPMLLWALRIAMAAMLMYVLFGMKRRQRIIPVIAPLANTTLEFVQTVGNVYFNKKDNRNIALKKITYFMEYIRSTYFLPTAHLNEEFVSSLSKKSGIEEGEVQELVNLVKEVNESRTVRDEVLLQLNNMIDDFYRRISGK